MGASGKSEIIWVTKNREIHYYDWKGNAKLKFILPWPVMRYTPTPDNKTLFFVKPDVENYIYSYSLK